MKLPKPPRAHVEFIGGMVGMILVLFVVQELLATKSAIDFAALELAEPVGAENAATAEEQRRALETGPMSIEEAMNAVARTDRNRLAPIRPEPSTDPGPAAGWLGSPSYRSAPEPLPPPPPPPAPEPEPALDDAAEPAPAE